MNYTNKESIMTTVASTTEKHNEGKTYAIELIETTGPVESTLSLEDTIKKLNQEIGNDRSIFIDGHPVMDEIITEETLKPYKRSITITNKLVGG